MSIRWLCFVALLSAGLAQIAYFETVVNAEPLHVDCRGVGFSAPAPGATVFGTVEITGRAQVPDFRFYKVEYSPIGREDWVLIGGDIIRRPVENGRLALWQTNVIPDGTYRLRMHVVDPTGNYCESFLTPIFVSNTRATEVISSPTPTETLLLTVVPPQPTPTTRPIQSTLIAPPQQTPGLPGATGLVLPDLNLLVLGGCFGTGACGMLLITLLVGMVMHFLNKSDANQEA